MGENTKIEWAQHSLNFWVGCTAVSAACDHCYAEALAKRFKMATWGHGEERKRTSLANWAQPAKWNDKAARDGVRRRVFCASMADVFDTEVPDSWRDELFALMVRTPNLDWLVLTKRPKVMRRYITSIDPVALNEFGRPIEWPLPNLWAGTTVENQAMADLRIPDLLATPAARRFLSCEPLLGEIDLTSIRSTPGELWNVLTGEWRRDEPRSKPYEKQDRKIDWVICGGESGPHARPMHPDWARSLRDQCQAAGVPFFFKQWGSCLPCTWDGEDEHGGIAYEIDEEHSSVDYDELGRARVVGAHGREFARFSHKRAGRLLDGREWNQIPGDTA